MNDIIYLVESNELGYLLSMMNDKTAITTTLFKNWNFESTHYVPAGHKCGRIHGHSFRVCIEITAKIDLNTG